MTHHGAMESADVLFEAVIVPHRSLSRGGLRVLLGGIALLCCVNATVFIHIGAWPVGGFTGVEFLLAALLFRLHTTAARASELVLLTPSELRIIRTEPNGRRRERVLSPTWLTVRFEERPGRVSGLWLGTRGEHEEIARSLGEDAKRDLADALAAALHRLRNPRFDNPQLQV